MRQPTWIVVAAGCVLAGLVVARGQPTTSAGPAPTPGVAMATVPESMVGHAVHIYFRGSDDLPYPGKPGAVTPSGTLIDLSGRVLAVRPGWIELGGDDHKPYYWVASSTVAFVADNEALLPTPTP